MLLKSFFCSLQEKNEKETALFPCKLHIWFGLEFRFFVLPVLLVIVVLVYCFFSLSLRFSLSPTDLLSTNARNVALFFHSHKIIRSNKRKKHSFSLMLHLFRDSGTTSMLGKKWCYLVVFVNLLAHHISIAHSMAATSPLSIQFCIKIFNRNAFKIGGTVGCAH